MKIKTIERKKLFETNSLNMFKCSQRDENVDNQWVYPATQNEIDELLTIKDREAITITNSESHLQLKLKSGLRTLMKNLLAEYFKIKLKT